MQDLLQPSLKTDQAYKTRSYELSNFFYVAFFGGIIPTILLGTQNAKWLRVNKTATLWLLAISLLIFLASLVVAALVQAHILQIPSNTLRLGSRVANVLVGLGYYRLLRSNYKQHQMLHGKSEPILGKAILWTITGITIEFGIIQLLEVFLDG